MALTVTRENRGQSLSEMKQVAGHLSWCYEAHRNDPLIAEARSAVMDKIKRVASGSISAYDVDMSIDDFEMPARETPELDNLEMTA